MNTRLWIRSLLVLTLMLGVAADVSAQANLRHRYSFDEAPGSTTAGDFYSGANGTLMGGADFTGTGAVTLNGTTAFVDLPNGIISALSDATFEAWVTWGGGAGNWQRIFDFGTSITGEGTSGTGSNYVFLTPRSSGSLAVFGARSADMTADNLTLTTAPLPTNLLTHVAVTYSPANNVAKLYVNGAFASQGVATQALASIQDVNNWLGRSQYGGDAYYSGLLNEFRIYDAALSAPRIAANAAAGPDNDAADPGNVTAVRLLAGPIIYVRGSQQARVFADFDNATDVNVTFGEGATFSSSDTGVITVDAQGLLRGVALGSAEIVASYQGLSATSIVAVVPIHGTTLRHRYSFSDPSGTLVTDAQGGAHGTLVDPGARCVFTGSTLVLSNAPNTRSDSATGSFVDLPNGIIHVLTNATFETWVRFVPIAGAWQRIFDFGDSSAGEGNAGNGISYIFLNPRTGTGGGTRFALKPPTSGETVVLDAPQLPNAMAHVVVTYHVGVNQARLYINGTLVAVRPAPTPLSVLNDVNNWLGRSQWGGDAYFNGVYDELRIYEGTMSEGDLAASRAAGPDTLSAGGGDLVGITLQAPATMQGGAKTVAVLADFQNVSGVNVTLSPDTVITSDDTNVVQVLAGGLIHGIGRGTATLTATYSGAQASRLITVSGGAIGLLKHRYNFNETTGTTVADSIGGADGTIVNPVNASFDGTSLWLNNPANNQPTNSYVDLPNGIISSLDNATFEMWVTWRANFTANWQRIFDFGSSVQGEGLAGTGQTYLFLTPRSGATGNRLRTAITTNSSGGERLTEALFTMAQNVETHVAVVYNGGPGGVGATLTLYVNGGAVGAVPTSLPLSGLNDFNNWLGRAQWGDPFFNGSYNEFRIYSGSLLASEIVESRALGPNTVLLPSLAIRVSQIELCWNSVAGRMYQAQFNTGVGTAWMDLGGPIAAASDRTCIVDPVVEGTPQRYYRVLLLP